MNDFNLIPKQWVLVRDNENFKWRLNIFSHIDNKNIFKYVCLGACYEQCIPYEGNENLLGTYNPYVSKNNKEDNTSNNINLNIIPSGTPMMCKLSTGAWVLRYYAGIIDGKHKVFNDNNTIADGFQQGMIPFDKFNPLNIKDSLQYNIQK